MPRRRTKKPRVKRVLGKPARNNRAAHLLRWFGISEEQYDALLQRQGGCCAVCLKPATSFSKRLAVDHNHQTGEIRGLLCTYCNRYVIGRITDGELLERAGRYLKEGTGLYVPCNRPKRRRRKK